MRNKYLLILFLVTSFFGYGQYNYVKVDDTYTPDQLIKEVLVNSACDLVSNVRYQYGSGVPAAQNIMAAGYFERNGSVFPFESGIVLSTDKSSLVPGPKGPITPSANQFRWTGDVDLNNLINDAGGWPGVNDARSTIIDFEFIPVQSTVGFEYVFASNSYYGCTWHCDNGALFGAWLIDTTTNTGQNLAVIPGTTDPISINTLRDGAKTGVTCGGVSPNAHLFDNAYGAGATMQPAISAPVNYSGITVAMQSLTANVVVGRKYRIKLAIIDFCENEAHTSAVFFNEGSFDIGNLDLGAPVLIADDNGLCVGDNYTLKSGLDPTLFTFEWYKDGIKIPGETSPDLVVNQTGDYAVKAYIPTVTSCVMEAEPVRVEFYSYVNILPPTNIALCKNAGTHTRFDLVDAVANVTTNPNIKYKFYTSQSNATNDTNAISDVYMLANSTINPVTIWVRAYEEGNPCPDIESFTLSFLNCNLALYPLSDLSICEGDAVQTFDLTVQTPLVYNNAVGYTVTYHLNRPDANTNQNAIPAGNLATYNGSHGERIWVRVTDNNNPLSYGIGSFFLYRYQLPLTQATILPLTACEIGSTGTANFDLNLAYITVPVTPVDVSLEFYSSQLDANLGNPSVALPVNYTGPAGTIYVRVRNLNGDCFVVVPLQLQIVNTPIANQIGPLTYCDLNNDGFGQFNLDATRVLIAGNPLPANAIVTFHETQNDADSNVNAIYDTAAYVNKVKDQQTIYVRVGFINSTCYNTVTLQLIVNKTPPITPIGFIEVCDINNDFVEIVNLRSKESEILQGLNAANYTVTYHTSAQNALSGAGVIANPTTFSTNVANVVWVRVVDNATGCFATSRIELRLVDMPIVANPLPIFSVCDSDANGFEVFDLASRKPSIVGTQQGVDVTFHYTNADAQAGINPLPNQYQNVSPNVQTIYVRLTNSSTNCFVVTTLKLEVVAAPVVNVPTTPFVICSDSGFGTINLFLYGKDLLDAMGENYSFKFYETQANAINDLHNITNVVAYSNLSPNNPVVWIRYEDSETGCFSVYPLHFELVTPPRLPVSLPNLVECDVLGNAKDQSTLFDLTQQEAAMLAVQTSPGTYQLRYFTSQAAAQNNTNWIVNPSQFQNTVNPQTIWIRIEDTAKQGGCSRIISFQIEVVSALELVPPSNIQLCDTALPNDGSMEIDLTVKEYELFGGAQPPFGAIITYYRTLQDAENGWNNIGNPKQFYNTTNPQTIYIAVENQYGCRSITVLTVRVLPLPEPNMDPTPLELCEDEELRNQGIFGQAYFDLTSAENDLSNYSNYSYTYYTSELGAHNGPGDIAQIDQPQRFFSGSSSVWVRVQNSFTGTDVSCYVVVKLDLIVNEWPVVGPITPLTACMAEPTLYTKFNLHDKDAEAVAGNNNPDDLIVKYFSSNEDAVNNEDPLPYTFENTTATRQTIWVRVENKKTGCFDTASLLLQIEDAVYAFKPHDTEFCETDYVNDGHSLIDLTVLDIDVIDNQPMAAGLRVRYERWNGTLINNPTNVQVFNGEVIRAVVYNLNPDLYCTASVEFTIRFKDAPEVKPLVDGIICFEYRDSSQLINGHYLDTGIPTDVNYTFDWTRNGVAVTTNDADILEDGRRIYVKRPGTYQVVVTGTNGCTTTRSAEVVQASAITIDEIKLTDSFGSTNAIEVLAYAGPGILLEYKLDNGSWQDSNIFLDVTPGEHTVYVRTKEGLSCEASKVITVMDYPKYFTPNNDGYNDTWNVWSLKNQPDAKIFIFDRFGKLIKQLSPAGAGWDGTFNGKPLPSTDYWFKAEYVDPKTGLNKEVTGHFSLKR